MPITEQDRIRELEVALEKEREAHESCIKTADLLREMISGLQVALIEEKERVDKVEHENRIMRIGAANQLRILHECLDILSPLDQIGEPNTLLSLVKKSMERVKELMKEVQKWQRIRTPTHGPCCTCQRCGQHYDDCRCDLDEVVDELEQTKSNLQKLVEVVEKLLLDGCNCTQCTWLRKVLEGVRK